MISAIGKRRFNQLICTNLATQSGFSWNQLEPRNSNSPRIFWTDLVSRWSTWMAPPSVTSCLITKPVSPRTWYQTRSIVSSDAKAQLVMLTVCVLTRASLRHSVCFHRNALHNNVRDCRNVSLIIRYRRTARAIGRVRCSNLCGNSFCSLLWSGTSRTWDYEELRSKPVGTVT